MLNQNHGISGTHRGSGRGQRLLDKWWGALWRLVQRNPLFFGSSQLYFYSRQLHFNVDQTIYHFFFPEKENLCLSSRLRLLVWHCLWFLGSTLQATAGLILGFATGWEHASQVNLGTAEWFGWATWQPRSVIFLFQHRQLPYLVSFSHISFTCCILHSWTPTHTFSLGSLNEKFAPFHFWP